MACYNNTPLIAGVQYPQPCDCCSNPDCPNPVNATCVLYTGPALPCSGIVSGDNLEVALQNMEESICAAVGDYSTYNTYCLAPITTQQQFVEAISEGYCNLLDSFDTFVNTTFVNYQTSVTNQFNAITNPGITCVSAGVTNTDTLTVLLNKYCTTFGTIFTDIDISGVDWTGGGCFAVPVPPSTIAEGFQMLVDKLCACGCSGGGTLPYFNNTGNCLVGGTASDSLVETIEMIITRLCQTPTFDINALTWGCLTKPSTTTTDLQAAFQTLLTSASDYVSNKLTFSADFVVSLNDPMDPCQGLYVELATPIVNPDRLVASNVADMTPGTLIEKLSAGTNVTLDDTTIPGQVIINAPALSDTYKVKADSSDTNPDFLTDKITGDNNTTDGIAISDYYNGGDMTTHLLPSINWFVHINKLFDEIQGDPVLLARFCEIVSYCGSTTTTTTTTTTGVSDFVLVPQYGLYFTGITGSGAGLPTYSYPVNTTQTQTYAGLTAQTFSVTINGTLSFPGNANVALLVNSLIVDCQTLIAGAPGTYNLVLPAPPSLGEEVRISIGLGSC